MASALIHMAVASEISKQINCDNDKLLIGSIAPDISKHLGQTKELSHFLDDDTDIPNLDRFLSKYKNNLSDSFVLGYYIHLYTDYLWFKYFIPEIYDNNSGMVTKLDGSIIKCDEETLLKYIYNDYTNLNIQLLDEYNMDLHIFYREPSSFNNIIEEIPMDKIQLVIDKISIIIEESKINKKYIFNINNIKTFINTSVELIISNLKEINAI